MKQDIKKPIIIGLIIIVVSISLIVILKSIKKSNNYLMLDNEIIKYEDGKYRQVKFNDVENELFRLIVQKQYLGNYYADHYDTESDSIFFKLDDKSYMFAKPLLGIQEDVNYIEFEKKTVKSDDLKELRSISSYEKINTITDIKEFNEATKVEKDLDNNGEYDTIYSFIYEFDETNYYSIIFIKLNNKLQLIDEEYGRGYNTTFSLEYIIDIDNDKNYELIISKSSDDIPNYSIYTLKNEYVESYFTSIGG